MSDVALRAYWFFFLIFFLNKYLFFLDGVRQFVIVTAIDELGVPNWDIQNAYKYGCVRRFCEKVSIVLEISSSKVIPVSNYFNDATQNEAKNAMSLFNLWRVFDSGIRYIQRHWGNKK